MPDAPEVIEDFLADIANHAYDDLRTELSALYFAHAKNCPQCCGQSVINNGDNHHEYPTAPLALQLFQILQ